MPESIIFPQDPFLDFSSALSWIPMVQWGDTSTSLLWRWDNWISSISSAGSLCPDFSPHSTSAGLFSHLLGTQVSWLRALPWSQASQSFLELREPSVHLPLNVHCLLADPSLQPHVSCSPFAVPLSFTWISRHLSELLSNHLCSSDTCQEYTGLHCWVEESLSMEQL